MHIRIAAMALVGCRLFSVLPCCAQERMHGNDLFVDIDKYVGKEVVLEDGQALGANAGGVMIKAGGVMFYAYSKDIDRETLRFLLNNCSDTVTKQKCSIPLLVTPTGKTNIGFPVFSNVRATNMQQGNTEKSLQPTKAIAAMHVNDLFVDIDKYVGKEVVLEDGQAFSANADGVFIASGTSCCDMLYAYSKDIHRETLRFLLNNCSDTVTRQKCSIPLLVTPTGKTLMGHPVLTDVRATNIR